MNPRQFVKEYGIQSLVCCFSGGKDSLVATHYTMTQLKNSDINKQVLLADTTMLLPCVIPYVRLVCQKYNWNLVIVIPPKSFAEIAVEKGFPRVHRRWCCDPLKLDPMYEYIKTLTPQRGAVWGIYHAESEKRAKYREVFRFRKTYWIYGPIINWTRRDIKKYIKDNELPEPPHYDMGLKETCMCSAFSSKKEIMTLKAVYPDFFEKNFVELEKQLGGYAAFNFNGNPCYAKDLAKQKTLG